jgi:hypothetical protein
MILFYLLFLLGLFPFITARAEDTARYSLNWVFLFGILAASFFSEIHEKISGFNKYIAVSVFAVVFILSFFYNFYPKLVTMQQVKQFSPLYFEACDWVKAHPGDVPTNATLFTIWSHRAIYNCQRNAVNPGLVPDMDLNNKVNVTLKAAKENGIDYIFIQKFSIDSQNRNIAEMYNLDFVNMLENNNQTFVKVFENGPIIQQCIQQGGCDGNIIYKVNWS